MPTSKAEKELMREHLQHPEDLRLFLEMRQRADEEQHLSNGQRRRPGYPTARGERLLEDIRAETGFHPDTLDRAVWARVAATPWTPEEHDAIDAGLYKFKYNMHAYSGYVLPRPGARVPEFDDLGKPDYAGLKREPRDSNKAVRRAERLKKRIDALVEQRLAYCREHLGHEVVPSRDRNGVVNGMTSTAQSDSLEDTNSTHENTEAS